MINLNDFLKVTDVRVDPGDSAFLIDTGKEALLYDSGFGFTGYRVAQKIKDILNERVIQYIFLTHSHYDHALGSAYVSKIFPDAKIVAGRYAASVFERQTAKQTMRSLDMKYAQKCGACEYEDRTENLRVDIAVDDGDIIKFGDFEFEALNLPGHTKCSIGYYCRELKFLLGCETLGVYNGDDDVVPSFLVGYQMTLDSIEKVRNLDIESILIPHYGLLGKEESKFYLSKSEESTISTANDFADMISRGKSKADIIEYFRNRFYRGYIKEIYPVDAMELNTSIMIELISREKVE